MTRTVMLRGPFALLLMAGFGVVWQLQKNIDVQRQSLDLEQKEVTLRSPGALKGLSLEYGRFSERCTGHAPCSTTATCSTTAKSTGCTTGEWTISGRCWISPPRSTRTS